MLVLGDVQPVEANDLLVAQDVEVRFDRVQRRELGGFLDAIGRAVDPRLLPRHLTLGLEAVEEHL